MSWIATKPCRLVDFIKGKVSEASIKSIRRALDANACRVNGKVERFASRRLLAGDRVEFAFDFGRKDIPFSIPILFEDEFLKIVDKPLGLVCDDAVIRRFFGSRHFLIHRLDKETSGLLMIAKSLEVKKKFIALFEEKRISKLYMALSDGEFSGKKAYKETYLAKKKEFAGQTIWGSSPKGLYACTHFEKIAAGKLATLFACKPITGRTHQIRVHLAELGYPILIDRQYAEKFRCPHSFSRILLHAAKLDFPHPITKERLQIIADLPRDMRSAIDLVGISSRHVSEFLAKHQETNCRDKRSDHEKTEEAI